MSKLIRSLAEANKIGGLNPDSGFKNYIINGGFDVWQHGTSFTEADSNKYLADHWFFSYRDASALTLTKIDAGLDGFKNAINYTVTTAGSYSNSIRIQQGFETVDVIKLRGKKVILSVRIRARDVNTGGHLNFGFSTSVDLNTFLGWDISDTVFNFIDSLILDEYVTFKYSAIVPSNANSMKCAISLDNGGNGAGSVADFTGFQLELGEVATDFEYRPYGLELSLCQRYYEQLETYIIGSGTQKIWYKNKRVTPTITDTTGGSVTNLNVTNADITDTTTTNQDHTITISAEL